jgi:sec-independent protein translocase protein TatA
MLNNIGLPGLLLIAVVVLVLFGKGKVSALMGEVGKGITAFKKGVNDGQAEIEKEAAEEARDVTPVVTPAVTQTAAPAAAPVAAAADKDKV